MSFTKQQVEEITAVFTPLLGHELSWRWEARFSVMLSEFARDKKDKTLVALRKGFPHEWNKKTIKQAPPELKSQLGEFTKLNKEQLIFSLPASDNHPTIIALWWPWGHGGTYSLRLLLVPETYLYQPQQSSFFDKIKSVLKK
ncbi:hypothetical protein [Thalassotalea sp. PLHSN55]|uniref:hypothetical protein n=1 Tax=Thalassotalea sp. PLHSN55 TaxID=3435888 RepID=UPI003F82ABD2